MNFMDIDFMRKIMTYTHWGLISALLVGLLGGCGLLPTAEPGASYLPTPTVMVTPPDTPTVTPTATPASRLLTLTLWVPDFLNPYDHETGASQLNAQLAAFSAYHPDVQVQVIVKKAQGTGGLYHILSTAYPAAPTVLPDLIILGQEDLRTAAREGLIQPLDEDLIMTQDYFSFALAVQEVQSQTYGIPLLVDADQMVYRGDVGATIPLSWTGVLTTGTAMLFPGGPTMNLADDALLSIYLGAGGEVVDAQGNPTLDRNVLETLYRFFDAMMQSNLIDPEQVLDLADATACWESYQQGAGRLSPVPSGLYWADPPRDSRPAWAPTPTGNPVALAHVWSLALVTQDARRQAAALELAQWLTAPTRIAELSRSVALLPPRADALIFWTLLPEQAEFLQTWLGGAVPALPATIDLPVRRALQSGLRALLEGNVSTAEAAAAHALTNLRQ